LTDASYEERNAVLLSARAELARDYIQLRDTQALLQIAHQNLEIARDATKLTQTRVREGVTTDLDVANASAQVATIESLIPTLESRSETTINAIGVLLAEQPGALRQMLVETRDVPGLPSQVPIGFPSELVQRRPDIRKAEAQLHAATAAIGMAKADFYPRISLNGSSRISRIGRPVSLSLGRRSRFRSSKADASRERSSCARRNSRKRQSSTSAPCWRRGARWTTR
jgi:outer membrane protein TolC